jgi:hypothetical protein
METLKSQPLRDRGLGVERGGVAHVLDPSVIGGQARQTLLVKGRASSGAWRFVLLAKPMTRYVYNIRH